MITINVIKVNEIEHLVGKIGKQTYDVKFSEEMRDALTSANARFNASKTHEEAKAVLEAVLEQIKSVKSADKNSLTEVLEGDLMYNDKSHTYHIISNGKTSKEPVHKFFVDKMIESNDKGISPKPWLVFWVRLMRNPLYTKNSTKVNTIVNYLKAQFTDEANVEKLMEEGYAQDVATKLSTFDQISITEEGILAAFKYVNLIDKKYVVKKNEETGEQTIELVDKYTRTLEVDEVSGEITKDELALPAEAEDFVFEPPCMGQSGDAFTCKSIDDVSEDPARAHVVKVGMIHELSKGFAQVNTNDDNWGCKGLHLGGYYYVQGFGGRTSYLVDCLVAPEDIGAVADVSRYEGEGAIRCRRYMVTGAHFQVSRGMYHPSDYAQLLDAEWEEMKKAVIADLNKQKQAVEDQL